MDEVIFRSSQKLENLQHQLGIAADEGKQFLQHQSENAHEMVYRILHSTKFEQLNEGAKKLFAALVELARDLRSKAIIFINPYSIYEHFVRVFGRGWSKRDICFGCAGFLLGGIVGYCIGLAAHKKDYMVRYMQAIQCSNYLGIESANVVEDAIAPYDCGKNEVLINVKAASVHVIDAKICEGYGRRVRKLLSKYYQYSKHDLPVTLGRDCLGIVTDIGQNVSRLEVGDEVWLTSPFWAHGTFAQTVLVPESRVSRKPKTVGFEGGCSLPYAGGVALDVLRRADLNYNTAKEKRILVQGGCTPVGCILIQLLRIWEAEVVCTCYRRALPVVKALGATDIIILQEPEYKNRSHIPDGNKQTSTLMKELELQLPFDVIINTKECGLTKNDFQKFCHKGIVLSALPAALSSDNYGFFRGSFFSWFVRLKCVLLRMRGKELSNFGETHICFGTLDEIASLVDNGQLQTVVDKVFHPHDIEAALHHIQSIESIGSTVITFR